MFFLTLFIHSSVAADFNCDGFDDLVMGAPGSASFAGRMHILYGTTAGLSASGDQLIDQATTGVEGTPEALDSFAASLAAGDFNGDGCDDAVAGVLGEDDFRGAASVLYGAASGVTATGDQLWTQDSSGIEGVAEAYDYFGASATTGDFNDDGYHDLAVGVMGEEISGVTYAGAINVIYGSSGGLTNAADQVFYRGNSGVLGSSSASAMFGTALADGDFNGDGRDDLAVGASGDISSIVGGSVSVLYGGSSGLSGSGDQLWHQDTSGISGTGESGDEFGYALTVCDFDDDGYEDLAVGSPFESVGSATSVGVVHVLYGTTVGLASAGSQLWSQDTTGVPGADENSDYFGVALACADFDGDGYADLAVGAFGESIGSAVDAGAVTVLYGGSGGLSATGSDLVYQDLTSVAASEAGDEFGRALAVGDYDSDGYSDLAVGAPGDEVDGISGAGAVLTLFGGASGVSTTTAELWTPATSGVLGELEVNAGVGAALR